MAKKPTAKQHKAVKLTLENLVSENPRPMGEIMKEAGYKPGIQLNPQIITESKGFKELLNAAIPDNELIRVAQEGLKATTVRFSPEGEQLEVDDYATRHKYWKDLHIFKGHAVPEDQGPKQQTINNFFYKPEITAKTKEFEEELKNLLSE